MSVIALHFTLTFPSNGRKPGLFGSITEQLLRRALDVLRSANCALRIAHCVRRGVPRGPRRAGCLVYRLAGAGCGITPSNHGV